jgi:hypothetical protein
METGDKQSASSSAPSLATYGVQRRPSQDTSRSISLRDGWNLLSIPVEAPGRTFEDLLPGCESGFFFDPKTGYRPIREGETIEPGPGFFAKCSTGTVEITGRVPDSSTVDVRAGWNLIGPFADTVGTRSVLSKPSGIVASGFLTYEEGGQYRAAERLLPGRGYWVRAGRSGTLDLTGGLEISPDSAALALVGETQEFTVESAPGDDPEVQWTTTDSAVVSVDPGGLATAGRAGTASVVAQVGELSDTARVQAEGRGFQAPSGAPIRKHLGTRRFVQPDTARFIQVASDTSSSRLRISGRLAVLSFKEETTVSEANAFLQEQGGRVVGTVGLTNMLYVRFSGDRTLEEAAQVQETMNEDPRVNVAAMDLAGLQPQALPLSSSRDLVSWEWSPDPNANENGANTTTAALQLIRAPQMWNFGPFRRSVTGCGTVLPVRSGPDKDHEDLSITGFAGNNTHATKVASVWAADPTNARGVAGVNPWQGQLGSLTSSTWGNFVPKLPTAIQASCGAEVFNYSGGVTDLPGQLGDIEADALFLIVQRNARVLITALEDLQQGGQLKTPVFFVASAGNIGTDDNAALFNDPITAAAVNLAREETQPEMYTFLSVENTNFDDQVVTEGMFEFIKPSNRLVVDGASVAAPGIDLGVATPGNSYGRFSGTSASVPLVAGLISALGQVFEQIGVPPDRRVGAVRTLLFDPRSSVDAEGTIAPRVDAFAAFAGIDGLESVSGLPMQRRLVNVDDGTADGNLRKEPFSGTVATSSRPSSDERVGMADFRAFRDAHLQLHGPTGQVELDTDSTHVYKDLNRDGCVGADAVTADGSPVYTGTSTPTCLPPAVSENRYSQFDFNGSVQLEVGSDQVDPPGEAVAPYRTGGGCSSAGRLDPGRGCLTDLMVLSTKEVWDSGEGDETSGSEKVSVEGIEKKMGACTPPDSGWNTTDLMRDRNDDDVIDYMRSFDLHVRLQADANALSDPSAELLHATTRPGGGSPRGPFPDFDPEGFFLRHGPIGGGSFLKCRKSAVENTVAVPLWSDAQDTTKVVYQRREGEENDSDNRYLEWGLTPQLGEDFALRIAPEEGKRASETQEKGTAETSPLLARSTSRGRADSIFSARELIWRDREDPATAGGAYAASSCLPDSGAHEGSKLHRRMTELAEETWIEKTEAEPKSLLRKWLGKENVEVVDPIVRRMSRAPGSITATAVQPGGCTINLGTLLCWDGVLGLPATSDPAERNTPRELEDDKDLRFRSVSVGGRAHVCARESPADSTRTFCWGSNGEGQVGDGTTQTRESPTEVAAPDSVVFTDVRAAGLHACAVTEDGEIFCWGSGERGQLGHGQSTDSAEPILVTGDQDWQQVTVAGFYSCGLTTGGEAYCWGEGPLGNGDTTSSATPRQVAGDHTFRQLDASETHVCGTTTDEKAFCWGGNGSGQLGDGTTQDRPEPTQIDGLPDARQVASGGFHTCAVTTGDDAYCWGENGSGQLGDGNGGGRELTPVEVTGGIVWGSLSARGALTCGISTGPTGYCWGGPGTQLGDGEDHQGHIHPHDTPRKLAAPTRQCPDGQKAGRLWGAWIEPTAVPEQPPPGGEE